MTRFQLKIFNLCMQIPKGKVTTYKALARASGSHPRAVGQALRRNPFNFDVVPCHRVVSSQFAVGGYLGETALETPKIQKKIKLLEDEGVRIKDGYVDLSARASCMFEDLQENTES